MLVVTLLLPFFYISLSVNCFTSRLIDLNCSNVCQKSSLSKKLPSQVVQKIFVVNQKFFFDKNNS